MIVETDGHGTAKAKTSNGDVTEFDLIPIGTDVTLVAEPASGYAFDKWEIIDGLGDFDINNNMFKMQSNNVRVKAVFKYTGTDKPEKPDKPTYDDKCRDNNGDHFCDLCGKRLSWHSGVLQNGQKPTKDSAGYKSYYLCSCGKAFEDEACQVEIPDLKAWMAEGGNGYLPSLNGTLAPQTGDSSRIVLLNGLMLLALSGVFASYLLNKRNTKSAETGKR